MDNATVVELPCSQSALEYVIAGEGEGIPTAHQLISEAVNSFIDSVQQPETLLVLGEPGCGKSMLTWSIAKRYLRPWVQRELLNRPACLLPSVELPWFPVLVELKSHKPGEIPGLLPRVFPGLWRALLASRGANPTFRVLVLFDGLDELLGGGARELTSDFVSSVCGMMDIRLPGSVLKIVVTTREVALSSRVHEDNLFGRGRHMRRTLLPFTKAQVCCVFL